ncbi:hypothetical protein [Massilia sp. IC2-476]|uniref:hypothetical protein n=1 Tax=Massilia sp. IC2-476 TaxID=2887199 RepID=UPI001D120C63|nr:hypothetical protein [Massilia sp. IC2-476]MCC2972725.1 hypothetical protein [Massilia sp. IC2-476]
MSFFSPIFNWAKSLLGGSKASSDTPEAWESLPFRSNPESTHRVLNYLDALDKGAPTDEAFEQTPLYPDLGFTSLSFAEILFARSIALNIPLERIVHFLSIGIVEGGDERLAILLQRVSALSTFTEEERAKLLESGLVGDRLEIFPITQQFNRVEFVIKFCRTFPRLKEQRDHDAIELEFTKIQEDPQWKR